MANTSASSSDVYFAGKRHGGYIAARRSVESTHAATAGVQVVYYIDMGDAIKIGTSSNFLSRIRQHGLPGMRGKDKVLALEFGSFELEKQRHREFAHLRVDTTEMFTIAPDLLAHIDELRRQHNIAV